jgi:hypothetical protein
LNLFLIAFVKSRSICTNTNKRKATDNLLRQE